MFASRELVARIERAECSLIRDALKATRARRPDVDVVARDLAGGVACYAGPHSPMNKVAGLGFAGEIAEDELTEVEEVFAARCAPVQVELATLADPAVGARLTRRGYVLTAYENVLGCALPADVRQVEEIVVDRVAEADREAWLDILVAGFSAPDGIVPAHELFPRDTLKQTMGDLFGARGFARYLARRAGEPAGGATMRVAHGLAQLCGAATLPAHRRRGVQTALLGARLADAARAECEMALVTVQPGSKSMENAQRRGFELLYARAILVRESSPPDG